MNLQKNKLFVIKTSNVIDIVTNSSSELFVLNAETLDIVKEMVENVYPNYLDEYDEIVCLRDAPLSCINEYFEWVENPFSYSSYSSKEEKKQKDIKAAMDLASKYGMLPEDFFIDWNDSIKREYIYLSKSDNALRKIANSLDPKGQIFLLFSIDENPNWNYQEKLMDIGERYHLG